MITADRTVPARVQTRYGSSCRTRVHRTPIRLDSVRQDRVVVDRVLDGNGSIADAAQVAAALKLPTWAAVIPGLHEHPKLLAERGLKGLVRVVD